MRHEIKTVTIADDATTSSAFTIEDWAIFIGLEVPTMVDGVLYVDMGDGIDGSYQPILDPVDGQDAVLIDSTSNPGMIDITDWVRFVPPTRNLRIRSAAAQTGGPLTLYIFLRG